MPSHPSINAPNAFGIVCKYDEKNWLTQSWLIYNPHQRSQVWRFLTYIFLHGHHQHITFNLIIQVLVGKSKIKLFAKFSNHIKNLPEAYLWSFRNQDGLAV